MVCLTLGYEPILDKVLVPLIYNLQFNKKKLSHQLQSGPKFYYEVAQLENYRVGQNNYRNTNSM